MNPNYAFFHRWQTVEAYLRLCRSVRVCACVYIFPIELH